MMMKAIATLLLFLVAVQGVKSQQVGSSVEYIKALTPQWKGERLPDGRPKIPDNLLERLKKISMEQAWGYLRSQKYNNQFESNWELIMYPDQVMVGRAVTAQYMPARPDLLEQIKAQGLKEGRSTQGGNNTWPIDVLTSNDVYVADSYGKIVDGTLIGDMLGNTIYTNSKNGVIFWGSVRDMDGLSQIEGFNVWAKGQDPSYIMEMTLTTINAPIRIGRATVLPGDAVLANKYGTIFIPSHLVEELVLSSEFTMLRDAFGAQRLREKKYLSGQIDSKWTDDIKNDFIQWLADLPGEELPMSREELDAYLKNRDFY
ncbi:RraA family protein [Olivibacter sp. SDN3]|uniref:RraA family protein n=1 Tax=Olivibacter sp. SDN3 TaxID=2764720 RepID=UPI002102EAC7|nr:RraA family protein [Olivibacter sp. SDN3]